jgi:hypothetical protein
MKKILLVALMAATTGVAHAETLEALGRVLKFTNPAGYCTPGKSERERALVDFSAKALGTGSRLLHMAVACSELADFKAGRKDMLAHWIQIQHVSAKGKYITVDVSREEFLTAVSGALTQKALTIDPKEINRQLEASLGSDELKLSEPQIRPLGRDSDAAYISLRMKASAGGESQIVTAVGGLTVVKQVPVLVNVYEGQGDPKSRAMLSLIVQRSLKSLISENATR